MDNNMNNGIPMEPEVLSLNELKEKGIGGVNSTVQSKNVKVVSPEDVKQGIIDGLGQQIEEKKQYASMADYILDNSDIMKDLEEYEKSAEDLIQQRVSEGYFTPDGRPTEKWLAEKGAGNIKKEILDEIRNNQKSTHDTVNYDLDTGSNIQKTVKYKEVDDIEYKEPVSMSKDNEYLPPEELDNIDTEDKETFIEFAGRLKKLLEPVTKKLDLASLTIASKPIDVMRSLNEVKDSVIAADFPLIESNSCITMKQFGGSEIELLDASNSTRNEYNTIKEHHMLIYNHIINEDKPLFSDYLKTVKAADMNNLYMAIYRATYGRHNILTYPNCPDCNYTNITTPSVDDMIKFKDDEVKAKYKALMSNVKFNSSPEVELVQISDKYAVALQDPTLYSSAIEPAALPEEMREQYKDIISIMPFLDNIYYISDQLIPIRYTIDPKDTQKTVISKFYTYAKIIRSFTSDQYSTLLALVASIGYDSSMTYVLPEIKCEKCGCVIPERAVAGDDILFMRHRLGIYANMRLK